MTILMHKHAVETSQLSRLDSVSIVGTDIGGLPGGVAVTAHLAEAERERWLPPAVAAADQQLPMLPPTRYTLRDLAGFGSVAEAMAAGDARSVERVLPILEGAELVMPWQERYQVPVPLLGGEEVGLEEPGGGPRVER